MTIACGGWRPDSPWKLGDCAGGALSPASVGSDEATVVACDSDSIRGALREPRFFFCDFELGFDAEALPAECVSAAGWSAIGTGPLPASTAAIPLPISMAASPATAIARRRREDRPSPSRPVR
jgi:hypothetical protein